MSPGYWIGAQIARLYFYFNKPKQTAMLPEIKKIPLKADQYYPQAQNKKHIICHHTAGGSATSSIADWASNPARIATAYVIDRDGSIYEAFDAKYWSYHIGAGIKSLEQSSIGIEICSYGALEEKGGKLFTYTGKEMAPEKAIKLDTAFRPGPKYKGLYWEKYTDQQIAALKLLLPYLLDRFKITMQPDRKNFWEYVDPKTLPPGIYSHTTLRRDKIDIFPQPSLVELVYGL